MPFHIDVPPPHIDVPPPHIDVPPPHVDVPIHVDVPPPHVDVPPPHIDVPPPHIDVRPPHVDVPIHVDIPPPHIDVPIHVDIPPPHIDVPVHVDIPLHVDIPRPHIDIASPHVDIPRPHIDIPSPHIDIGHVDLIPHIDTAYPVNPPAHVDATPPHVDIGYNHWWQNWPKTHGYVARRMLFPISVSEIAAGVRAAEHDRVALRAVGGGWSFSDAALPGDVVHALAAQPATGRPDVMKSDAIDQFLPLAEGFPLDDQPSIASIDATNHWLTGYSATNVRTIGGAAASVPPFVAQLTPPQPQPVYLMNTRSLKSTLQAHLHEILSDAAVTATAPGAHRKFYFHVEGGITMAELGPLLDAQSPRLQLEASGGNPGATLAGSMSTATHGAEFTKPLLIDRVKAIHLVGPGGQQWWIEGAEPIANPAKLQQAYPGLDAAHIIAGTAPVNGLLPQDWLNAVVVSMGCMGVIYSVVLEVFPLEGSQQVTAQTTWFGFLAAVQAQHAELRGLTIPQIRDILRDSSHRLFPVVNNGIATAIENGSFTMGVIPAGENLYADLAFNPNPAPAGSHAPMPGDCDCWIVNRRKVPVPFDRQPPASGGIGSVVDAVFKRLGKAFAVDNNPGNLAKLVLRMAQVYGLTHPFHVDIPSPHIDIPSPHIDIPSPHIDIPSPHIDLGHVDLGHVDIPGIHIDLGHVDVPPPHIDIPSPHIDVPSPHIDIGHIDLNAALEGAVIGLTSPLVGLLGGVLGFVPGAAPIIEALLLGGLDLGHIVDLISRIAGAHDTLDVALDVMTRPMAAAAAVDLAQPFLSGFLAATLGTANHDGLGIDVGTEVGSVGFPDTGLLGAGIEIGLPLATAFGFMQTHVLDKMDPNKPFFGYVSVRLCKQTTSLLGMQQWPMSVMIEVVSFSDTWGLQYMSQLQMDTLSFIDKGGDAMLHWGLENEQMTARHLGKIPALQRAVIAHAGQPPLSKLAAWKLVRSLLFANNGRNAPTLFPAFNNAFTSRLAL